MEDKTVLKQLAEQKLKAFAVGNMGKRALTKKELEELRKKEEDEAAAHAFQEFVSTFQEPPSNANKIWVKAGTYDAGARKEDLKEKGKLYKPQSRISASNPDSLTSAERAQEYARLLAGDIKPERLGKRKEKDKKKSNLELFKEELKQIQEEREERHKYKGLVKMSLEVDSDVLVKSEIGSFDNGDPNTTNLYLGNLNPKITETQLMELFGKYGPLASIKIMWPRSEEEKARGRNCGFVAFMNRRDGERALRNLNGKDIMGYEMKLGWGKCVPIPSHPIYIPPALQELSQPPPPSGFPFNAQPLVAKNAKDVDKSDTARFNKLLSESVIKVVIPTDRNILALIHRTIEFVIREGPLFEAIIMNREINNPQFRFLFDNQSHQHTYYRWKLYSMMQGDSQKEWRLDDFRMFIKGPIWRPPPMNIYTQGMPDNIISDDEMKEPTKGALSVAQRDRLEELLRNLTPDRMKVAEAMVFAIEHSVAADEICSCILESLSNLSTCLYKKVARLYLVSDILHNSSTKVNNASYYRRAMEIRLVEIFRQMHATAEHHSNNDEAKAFKYRISNILEAWKSCGIYARDFIQRLENIFLGLEMDDIDWDDEKHRAEEDSEDGIPIEDDADGEAVPFDGAALLKGAIKHGHSKLDNSADLRDDPDGMPLTPPPPKMSDEEKKVGTIFIPSRWKTVDPEQVVAQAMTTSKWDQLEASSQDGDPNSDESNDSQSNMSKGNNDINDSRISEERRRKLREVEVKAIQYQDEIEAGSRALKSGWTVPQQVEHYRRKLLRKMDKKSSDKHKSDGETKSRSSPDKASPSSDRSDSSDVMYSGSSRKYKNKKSRSSSGSMSPAKVRSSRSSRSRSPVERKSRSRRSRSKGARDDRSSLSPPSPPRIRKSPSGGRSRKRSRGEGSPSWTRSPPTHRSRRGGSSSPSHAPRYRSPHSPENGSKYQLTSPSPPPRTTARRHHRQDSPAAGNVSPPSKGKSNGGRARRRDDRSPSPAVPFKPSTKHRRTQTPSPPPRKSSRRSRSPAYHTSNPESLSSTSINHSARRHKHRY